MSLPKSGTPESNVIDLLTAVIYKGLQKASVFVPGRPYKPSSMFMGKARSLPRNGTSDANVIKRFMGAS
jgi:hypothetical protein